MDDMEIDPAIAEAMGFAGFGGKKRKQGATTDAFVDPGLSNKHAKASEPPGKGSNNVPLGVREKPAIAANRASGAHPAEPGHTASAAGEPDGSYAGAQQPNDSTLSDTTSLQALRHGVKNERGDMVYFLPSFLEDPWKDLKPQ